MAHVPELERHCGSWIIVNRETGGAVCELYDRARVETVNQDRFEVLTAAEYLGRLNKQLKGCRK